jgi:hypothetical protein
MGITSADLLLQQFAECSHPGRSEEILEALVVLHAQPGIRKIVAYKLAFQGAAEAQDIDDVSSDVLVELLARLRAMKSADRSGGSIGAFSGYTATAAYHACNEYLRRKYPNRHRLKTRLRYLLNTEPSFAIWETTESDWICGLRKWLRDGRVPASSEKLAKWKEKLSEIPRGPSAVPAPDLLLRIFKTFSAPVEFDELVNIVAGIWGVRDAANAPEQAARAVQSGEADPTETLHLRRWMGEVWCQIRELPQGQRAALLLNLRAGETGPALALLPIAGVASIREIAEVLGFAVAEFAGIWNQLPWDDLTIAQRLGLKRQQVINLRKSARERLIRRMGGKYRLFG